MGNKRCIFNSTIDCVRFEHGEYICMILREKCENLKYRMSHLESESGELINLIFTETI